MKSEPTGRKFKFNTVPLTRVEMLKNWWSGVWLAIRTKPDDHKGVWLDFKEGEDTSDGIIMEEFLDRIDLSAY